MADEDGGANTKRFWVGQNIFVAVAGAGLFVVFEHPGWGVLFMLVGIGGLIYSIHEDIKKSVASSIGWIVLILLTWSLIGYDYYDRHSKQFVFNPKAQLRQVEDQRFANTVVPLDGIEYHNCVFEHVTFKYNGTSPIHLGHNNIIGPIRLSTDNQQIRLALELQSQLAGIPIVGSDGKQIAPGVTRTDSK